MSSIHTPVSNWSFAKRLLSEDEVDDKIIILIDYSGIIRYIDDPALVHQKGKNIEICKMIEYFSFEVFTSADSLGIENQNRFTHFYPDATIKSEVRDAVLRIYDEFLKITKEHLPGFHPLCMEHCNCILDISSHPKMLSTIMITIDKRAYGSFSKNSGDDQCAILHLREQR